MQKRQNKHPDPTPWLFLGPSLCGVTLFVLAPFVETVRRSVTDTMGRHFVGLANYTAVLGNDAFRLAVENTVRFIGVCVPLLLDTPEYFTTYWNTCLQTFPQLAGQLVVGAPAAWALSRLKFRGRGAVRGLYLILMLLPFQVTMVPAYLTINHLGLMDTVWAVILPGAFSTFPVFVMQRGFDAVPLPLLEAAAIDGATPWQQFARIGLPVGLPGILAALTMSFLDAWNALEQPMTFLKTQSLWSLSLYLTDTTRDLALTMAASLFALLPAVLIFAFGQKYLEQGILAGAVKG